MKKLKIKLYTVIITFFVVSFIVFFGGYVFLSNYFIEKAAGNNFVNMTDQIAVEFNLHSVEGFKSFKDAVDLSNEANPLELLKKVETNKDKIDIRYVNEFKLGFIDDINHTYYLEGNEYKINNDYNSKLFDEMISFCNFSYFLKDNTDTTNYIVYRYKNIILYFDSNNIGRTIFSSIVDMKDSKYMILDNLGNILYEKDSDVYNKKLYNEFHLLNNVTNNYDKLVKDLEEENAGFGIFKSDHVKKLFVYSPIIQSLDDVNLFICYSLEYDLATETSSFVEAEKYLRTSLIVIFVTLFVVLNVLFYIINAIYTKKEYEFSLSRVNRVFLKPYSLLVNKKGDILSYNKSFKYNIYDYDKYQNVFDLELFTETKEDILTLIKKQISFTIILKSINKTNEYIYFIPMKLGFKYCLLGENKTEEILESLTNKQIALYNAVTNLPNRFVLIKRLNELSSTEELYITNNSLIAIDIADFSKINKIFGYTAADKILCMLRDNISHTLSNYDFELFNIRTSLFIVLLKNVQNYNDVIAWSKQCLQMLQEPVDIQGNYMISIDVRMGIYNIEASKLDVVDSNQIYGYAIAALERAKNSRLTKCAIYSNELGKMFSRDQIMEEDLKQAIINREFVMFYQAQYNTKLKKVIGFEALVRWNNPKYRLESVEHFINLAEKNGMIVDIGRIIIEETFKFAKSISKRGVHISMNVSPVQLLQSGFVNELIEKMNQYELEKGSIAIEITETFLMENSDSIIAKLKLLRENGFHIHLDDFGIGYSSMLYLKDLPIDAIKIDKQFVREMVADKFARIIVTKVVQIATSLDLDIISEGVETDKQSDMLSKMGCNIIQGYLISKPVSSDDAFKLIKKSNKDLDESNYDENEDLIENDDSSFDNEIELLEDETKKKTKLKKKKVEEE